MAAAGQVASGIIVLLMSSRTYVAFHVLFWYSVNYEHIIGK